MWTVPFHLAAVLHALPVGERGDELLAEAAHVLVGSPDELLRVVELFPGWLPQDDLGGLGAVQPLGLGVEHVAPALAGFAADLMYGVLDGYSAEWLLYMQTFCWVPYFNTVQCVYFDE